jgi:hypothetical protein
MNSNQYLKAGSITMAALCFGVFSTAAVLPVNNSAVATLHITHMTNPEKPAPKDNELTAAEKKAGWKLLFDGKTTQGWRIYQKQEVSPKWQVQDGAITLTEGGAGDLITTEEYGDFELELEWKIAEGGNSGIIFHVHEDPKFKATYNTGPEMQVLDDERHPDAKQGKNGNRTAGSLYDMLPPAKKATKPAGQWNKVKLVIKDGKAQHWMNGVKTVEYATKGPEWDKMVADSKFKGWEGFGKYDKGHIALQDHGDKVMFKNIKIRPL